MLNFGLDRDAAGRSARRLAEPGRGAGRKRRRHRARAGAGLRHGRGRDRRLLAGVRLDRPPPRPGHAGARAGANGRRDRACSGPQRDPVRPERSGLETEEVALANAIVTVPINPEFGSLNLAQAVILLAYEWSKRSALAQPTGEGTRTACAARRARRPDRSSSTTSSRPKAISTRPRAPRRPRTRSARSSPRPAGRRAR